MEMIETETTIVVLNAQPEFTAKTKEKCSADYFILVEREAELDVQSVSIAGVPVISWVARACERKPKVLEIEKGQNVLDVIKPYLSDADYSVVLYASTPLVTKSHIRDLLGFVAVKRMNACKLKKGYVFKNDYIRGVDEVYSVDEYDFSSDDLFYVSSMEDLAVAESSINKRILNYHSKNGVEFESACTVTIDASVEILAGARISSGVCLQGNTQIGANAKIGDNVVIKNSKIGDDVIVGDCAMVVGSVVKNGTIVLENAMVHSSAIMEQTKIGKNSKVISSKIKQGSTISDLAEVYNSRLAECVFVGVSAKVVGENMPTLVMRDVEIGAAAIVIDAQIEAGTIIKPAEIKRGGI